MIAFTPDQEAFRRAVGRFVDAEVVPAAQAIDEAGEFPSELFRRCGELGYLGLRYPEAYGGAEADMVTYCLLAEELARGSLSLAASVAMQSLMGTWFVYKYGSEALRQRYLVPALRAELIATFALTEPNAGSDLASITTRAERRGAGWVLNGTKTWVTNAPIADLLTVGAKTSAERGLSSIALFLVDRRSMRGITLGKKIEKMSVRGSETGEIVLEDVEVPDDHLLGGATGGVEKVGRILSEIRVMTAALSVGLARAAYQAALEYARQRHAFGKPIVEHQAITFKLADMLTSLHAATVMTYQAASALDAGRPVTREAAMTKLFASEMAVRVTDEAARIFASYGLASEYPVQRYFRDARFLLPGGGTSEILRLVIGRDLDWDRAAVLGEPERRQGETP
ncbi:MAG: acyl-CoA dehydrogenase family protein [Candidatus Rokubacteria bacterium]|nr:acyl-CoA dehydrogenase family protein [Candidatus Rokubacteria bacterium]